MENIKPIKTEDVKEGIKEPNEEIKEEKKASDWILMVSIAVIILILAVIISFKFFQGEEQPETIDDLHSLNLNGKLKPDQGYMYGGYSFVFVNGLWYTQVQTISGTSLFDIPLHYGPNDLEDIPLEGSLNSTLFNSERGIFVTFDPLGQNLNYVALAVGEFDQNIIKAFNKIPVAACDKNETKACAERPIITCDKTKNLVLYLQQEPEPKVIFDNNCMIVRGQGQDIVRSVDRLLLRLYGIMP